MAEENKEHVEMTQEQIAAQFNEGHEDSISDNAATITKLGDNGIVVPQLAKDKGEGGSGEGDLTIVELTEDENSAYGEYLGGKIPEEVFKKEDGTAFSRKEVIQNLNKKVSEVSLRTVNEDPFISSYMNAKKVEGFDQEAYIQSLNAHRAYDNMSHDEILTKVYEAQGKKAEDIEEHLKTLTTIRKEEMASGVKEQLRVNAVASRDKLFKENIESRKQAIDTSNVEASTDIDKFANGKLKTDYPLKFDEDQTKEIVQGMKSLLTKSIAKDEYGNEYETFGLDELLTDNDKLREALPILSMINNGTYRTYMTKFKQSIKDGEFGKLEDDSAFGTGGNQKGINREKLYNS